MSNKGRQIKRLDQKQFYNLVQYTQREYVASDVSDKAFAEQAEKSLGYPISETSVASARDIVGIQAWKDRHAAPKVVDDSRVASLEARLVAQEDANGRMHNRVHQLEDQVERLKRVVETMTHALDKVPVGRMNINPREAG